MKIFILLLLFKFYTFIKLNSSNLNGPTLLFSSNFYQDIKLILEILILNINNLYFNFNKKNI